ncbi:MAG: Polysaccharide export protein EpsE [Betaproteobacteria bacterium]|nr:Polysaccharide export protein EpsE [Betaproteobacteria bacterium]
MTKPILLRALLFFFGVVFALTAEAQQAKQPEYELGQGDSIRIVIFQNPDLTVETRVTENGTVSYPLVGSIRVGGMTIPEAERTIAKALSDGGFIQKPQVNIVLLQNRGNQVSVLGAVNRPGRFPLETANTRVSEMIAIGGGITPMGADIIIITGLRNGKAFRREIDVPGMFLDDKPDTDMVVAGGDVIYVYRMPLFYIYGEVQKPGSARIERAMTVRQALAQSGGPTVRGTERRLRLYRRVGTNVEMSTPNLNDLVQPDDVLYVNQSLF